MEEQGIEKGENKGLYCFVRQLAFRWSGLSTAIPNFRGQLLPFPQKGCNAPISSLLSPLSVKTDS